MFMEPIFVAVVAVVSNISVISLVAVVIEKKTLWKGTRTAQAPPLLFPTPLSLRFNTLHL